MKQITCLIVDDEPNALRLLEDHIRKVPHLQLRHKCFDAFEVLEFLKSNSVDLMFLDINMPQLSGMELAAMMPKDQKIIFTTAYSEFALEGYEYNAVDYLLKPVTFKRFMQAVSKLNILEKRDLPIVEPVAGETEEEYMFVKSGKQIIKVEYQNILYFEALKEYVCIYTPEEKLLVYKRMKELEESLPKNFIRVHNSYIININHLQKIDANQVIIGKEKIPVSNSYRDHLLEVINKRMI